MEEEKKEPQEIKIEIDDVTAQGVYINLAMIGHSDNEFVLDFIFVQPQTQKAKVRARVITSPGHAKRLLSALGENIAKYEQKHGEIKISRAPEGKVGFLH